MYLKEKETVCGLCRRVFDKKDATRYICAYDWGSMSGTPSYSKCCPKCAKTKLKPNGEVIGRPYA